MSGVNWDARPWDIFQATGPYKAKLQDGPPTTKRGKRKNRESMPFLPPPPGCENQKKAIGFPIFIFAECSGFPTFRYSLHLGQA